MTTRPFLMAALLLLAPAARAELPVSNATAEARAHFRAGLQRAQQGDYVEALLEFESAYATAPHFSVLYNIAQTRATLARPVEAVAAFEQYLRDGGERIPEARRQEVAALLESNRNRIGQLQVTVDPQAPIRAWFDGKELAPAQLSTPIPVPTGEHNVVLSNGDGFPESHVVTVTHAAITKLIAPKAAKTAPPNVAQLAITCDVPDVDVEIDGLARTKTPMRVPVVVPAGPVSVRFSRVGYTAATRSAATTAGQVATLPCGVREALPLPPALRATLVVRTRPSDAQVTVDGRRFSSGPLPIGIHRLRVEQEGYEPQSRSVSLASGKQTIYPLTLAPTTATRERQQHARARHKTWGLVVGGTGTAFLATGVGLYTWNSGRYDDWHAVAPANYAGNTQRAVSIQRVDDASLGLIALGAALSLGGAWLIWAAE